MYNKSFWNYISLKDIDMVKLFLESTTIDPSSNENEALQIACIYGYQETVKVLLLDYRVDPTANKCNAFIKAMIYDHMEVVKILLQDGRVDPSV